MKRKLVFFSEREKFIQKSSAVQNEDIHFLCRDAVTYPKLPFPFSVCCGSAAALSLMSLCLFSLFVRLIALNNHKNGELFGGYKYSFYFCVDYSNNDNYG